MKFINDLGFYPLYVGDVQQQIPGWVPGDPLPDGWHQVTESERPPDETTYREILNPEPVEGFIPPGCEGIREGLTLTQHTSTASLDPDDGQWIEVWEPLTTSYDEPYPVVAVKQDGEWLNPTEYIIKNPGNS